MPQNSKRSYTQIDPINLESNVAIGVPFPFNAEGVFYSTYTTKEQVKSNLLNVLLTEQGERLFLPNFGVGIRNLLFEPDTPVVKIKLKKSITSLLKKYEPRIRVVAVVVNSDSERQYYNISVGYNIINLPGTQSVSVKLERLR